MAEPSEKLRLDKWLWYARFFKTRGLASKTVAAGHVRINGEKAAKPAQGVGPGDVLTFPQARRIRVIRVIALGSRRGPAAEAQALYDDVTPPEERETEAPPRAGARPTKRDRRAMEAFRSGSEED